MRVTIRHRLVVPMMRALVLVTLCGALVAPQAMAFFSSEEPSEAVAPAARSKSRTPFKIKGQIDGLVPGKKNKLQLRVVNKNKYPLKVKWLGVRAEDSDVPGCEAPALKIPKRKPYSMRIEGKRGAIAEYPIRLKKTAPAECQMAQWPLRYTGRARKVR